jgi:acyl-coenzyme A synthetase/AMP-(fatty) acid ligase
MDPFTEKLERILAGPSEPDCEFVVSKHSFRAVYALAEKIRTTFGTDEKNILVRTQDKALIAAAVLASLVSDFLVVFPYALSDRAAEDIRITMAIDAVLDDHWKNELSQGSPHHARHDDPILSAPLAKKPDQPFIKFFTGGSTGKPKSWIKTPENIFGEAFYLSKKLGFSKDDRVFSTAPPYHIYGFLFSVLTPFVSSSGVLHKECSFPEEIRQCIRNDSPTVFAAVPVHYRILNGGKIPAGALRLACSSAGRLEEADSNYFHEKTGVELVEIYGSTETGGIAFRSCSKGEEYLTPFEVVEWKVIDERLHVRSPFISPDIPKNDKWFFRTSDRVRKIDSRRIKLLGRADDIVKVGGNRLDLENIREKIKATPGVVDAAVFALASGNGRQNDICAVVQGHLDAKNLKSSLSESLEVYAVPKRIKMVDKLPISSAGKFDREALKAIFTRL